MADWCFAPGYSPENGFFNFSRDDVANETEAGAPPNAPVGAVRFRGIAQPGLEIAGGLGFEGFSEPRSAIAAALGIVGTAGPQGDITGKLAFFGQVPARSAISGALGFSGCQPEEVAAIYAAETPPDFQDPRFGPSIRFEGNHEGNHIVT